MYGYGYGSDILSRDIKTTAGGGYSMEAGACFAYPLVKKIIKAVLLW